MEKNHQLLEKNQKGTVRVDLVINADIKDFFRTIYIDEINDYDEWLEKCRHWKDALVDVELIKDDSKEGISKYAFVREFNKCLKNDSVIVTDAGTARVVSMQTLRFTSPLQRHIGSAAQCEMGFALPGAVGVSIARHKAECICFTGDGSLQMNIQELQTCVTQKLPVKIFVWNNGCYATIIGHQKSIFKGRYVGVDAASGTAFPSLGKIADAYGIVYYKAQTVEELRDVLPKVMAEKGPVICDVICWKEETIPQIKAKFRTTDGRAVALPPEDMFPPIDRELFEREMIIEPIRWWK